MTDYATKDLTRTVPSNEILKVKKDRKYIKKERFTEEEKAERKKNKKLIWKNMVKGNLEEKGYIQ
jgi:hypothetical protein